MAKRQLTEEQKEVLRERLAKARAAKSQNKNPKKEKVSTSSTKTAPVLEPREDTISTEDYLDLVKEVQELKKMLWNGQQRPDESVKLQGGKLIGTVTKYDLSAAVYPNPISRLTKEPKLARYAFEENYDLNFDVGVSEYPTIDGIRVKEPKFTLELAGRIYNEETGELTAGRYIICRLIMHEDPEAALVIAREQDLEVDEANEEDFLNEMRYIRMRDWLIQCFMPSLPKPNNRKKEMVVGGKIVEFYEITAEEADNVKIPFDKLNRTKML